MSLWYSLYALPLLFTSYLLAATPPHVLFIVVDDLGWTDLGYHGAEFNTTNFDKLATSGIDLTSYYVQAVCTPTRSSFMTGLYPWRIGLQNPGTLVPGCKGHIPLETPTIAELLKNVGYNTQMIGKWHVGYAAFNMTPTGRGFNDFLGYYNGAEDYYLHYMGAQNGYDLVYNNKAQQQLNGTYNADTFFSHFNNYLAQNYNKSNSNYIKQPLFMYLALQTVHAPIQKPPMVNINGMDMTQLYDKECGHINEINRQHYCEKLQYVDVYIGDLIDLYKELDLFDNTLIILTTDNGGMPLWNGTNLFNQTLTASWGQNYPLRAGKVTLFEGGVRGLSFVTGALVPDNLRGSKNNNLYGAIDWLPSILSYVGADNLIPKKMDGLNIFDSLFNHQPFDRKQIIIFENFDAEQVYETDTLIEGSIIDNGWKYIHGEQLYNCYYPAPPQKAICLSNATITSKYLFDLKNDPNEVNNLVGLYPERVAYMIDLLVQDAKNNGYVYNEIENTMNASCPQWHNGCWMPWLDDADPDDIIRPNCVF